MTTHPTRLKVLQLYPEASDPGGVSNLLVCLNPHFEADVHHFTVGMRADEKETSLPLVRLLADYARFIKTLVIGRYDVIHINPSLDRRSIPRDGLFIFLAWLFRSRIVVFFHGWDEDLEAKLIGWRQTLFRWVFDKAHGLLVLGSRFEKKLKEWGFRCPIQLVCTSYDERLIAGLNMENVFKERAARTVCRIFFLSRIFREKGIFETLEAFRLLLNSHPNLELMIAGDGEDMAEIRARVLKEGIRGVEFLGYVRGESKKEAFLKADIFCLPTYFPEGLPVSLLEALIFGLPVVTRATGGIGDWIRDGEHGVVLQGNVTAEKVAAALAPYVSDAGLRQKTSRHNFEFAKKNFSSRALASKVDLAYRAVARKVNQR